MSLFTSTTGATGILPPDYGQLVIQPAMDASVFAQVATVVFTVPQLPHSTGAG
jgi:hypothetical protein